ncbi:hypothetical protein LXL04_036333 [Taraxacum kok-saghyz]
MNQSQARANARGRKIMLGQCSRGRNAVAGYHLRARHAVEDPCSKLCKQSRILYTVARNKVKTECIDTKRCAHAPPASHTQPRVSPHSSSPSPFPSASDHVKSSSLPIPTNSKFRNHEINELNRLRYVLNRFAQVTSVMPRRTPVLMWQWEIVPPHSIRTLRNVTAQRREAQRTNSKTRGAGNVFVNISIICKLVVLNSPIEITATTTSFRLPASFAERTHNLLSKMMTSPALTFRRPYAKSTTQMTSH